MKSASLLEIAATTGLTLARQLQLCSRRLNHEDHHMASRDDVDRGRTRKHRSL